ncbi:MAG: preprotein translocase subunit SecE [Lachnospiraceae bacterium]|jgi:preprotein translocase subunit SecE|nr:preprotein translocase subunit SecE [Lachnospiraceae bacterium]
MSEQATEKKSWFKGLKAEFNKIVWATPKDIAKQSGAVVAVSIVLGLVITVLDYAIQNGIDVLVKF